MVSWILDRRGLVDYSKEFSTAQRRFDFAVIDCRVCKGYEDGNDVVAKSFVRSVFSLARRILQGSAGNC
jgi:hypothetical protein